MAHHLPSPKSVRARVAATDLRVRVEPDPQAGPEPRFRVARLVRRAGRASRSSVSEPRFKFPGLLHSVSRLSFRVIRRCSPETRQRGPPEGPSPRLVHLSPARRLRQVQVCFRVSLSRARASDPARSGRAAGPGQRQTPLRQTHSGRVGQTFDPPGEIPSTADKYVMAGLAAAAGPGPAARESRCPGLRLERERERERKREREREREGGRER